MLWDLFFFVHVIITGTDSAIVVSVFVMIPNMTLSDMSEASC